jgi:hypothetical protein
MIAVAYCFSIPGAGAQDPPSREMEKISEGQYVRLKDNQRVSGSEQNWVLWRLPTGGYELEDHFLLVNPATQLLAQLSGAKLSRELQRTLESAASQTSLVVRSGPDRKRQSLTILGKKLTNGQAVDVLKCDVTAGEVRCKGRDENAKLRVQESEEFFYAFPFPMLLSAWLAQLTTASAQSSQSKLVVLDFVVDSESKPNLMQCERRIEAQDDEIVMIGDHQFRAHKAKVKLIGQNKSMMELTLWYGAPGLVYAMDGGGPPGERMALVQYKKYSDF